MLKTTAPGPLAQHTFSVRHAHLKAVLTRLSLGLLQLLLCDRDSFCGFAWHSGLQQKLTYKHYKVCKNEVNKLF